MAEHKTVLMARGGLANLHEGDPSSILDTNKFIMKALIALITGQYHPQKHLYTKRI